MSPVEQVSLAWHSLIETLRSLLVPALWVPWLLLGVFQAALVVALGWFAHPAVSWFAVPLVRQLGGEESLHYPRIFRVLPALYARADLVVGALLGAIVVGAATALFAARFSGREPRPRSALGWAVRRAPALILVNLPLNLLLVGLSMALDRLLERPDLNIALRQAITIGGLAGAMVLQALFLYATPLVAVSGLGAARALATLPRAFSRGAWAAFVLAVLAVLALLPLQQLAALGDTLVERGNPELVAWMTAAQAALGLLAGFVLTGAATLIYQSGLAQGIEAGGRRP